MASESPHGQNRSEARQGVTPDEEAAARAAAPGSPVWSVRAVFAVCVEGGVFKRAGLSHLNGEGSSAGAAGCARTMAAAAAHFKGKEGGSVSETAVAPRTIAAFASVSSASVKSFTRKRIVSWYLECTSQLNIPFFRQIQYLPIPEIFRIF